MAAPERTGLYARVSSASQEREGYSLGAQVESLRAYAARLGLEVVAEVVETGSASRYAKRVRPGFARLLDQVRAGEIDSLCVVALDRATRTPRDAEELLELMEAGVRLHQVALGRSQGGGAMAPEDRYMLRLEAARAELEVAVLSRRVRAGQDARRRSGLPLGPVPPGLRHARRDGRRVVELDDDQAPRVRLLLEEYAEGRHSIDTLTARARELGVRSRLGRPVRRSAVATLLGNPLLAGRQRDGSAGAFPAVVPEDLWYQVQAVREIQRTRPCGAGKQAFALGQLLRCSDCRRAVVGVRARGRSARYTYYRCSSRTCPASSHHVPEAEMLAQAQAILARMHVPDDLARALHSAALDVLREQAGAVASEREDLRRRADDLEERVLRATERRIAGDVDAEATQALVHRWRGEQVELRRREAALGMDVDEVGEVLGGLLDLARGVAGVLARVAAREPRVARQVLAYYLEDGATLERGELRAQLREPFASWATTATGTARGSAPGAVLRLSDLRGRRPDQDTGLEPPRGAAGADPDLSGGEIPEEWAILDGAGTGAMALLMGPRPGPWLATVLEEIRRAA